MPFCWLPGPVHCAVGWSWELREELLHLPKGDLLDPTVAWTPSGLDPTMVWTHHGLDPQRPGPPVVWTPPWAGPPVVWTHSGLDPQWPGSHHGVDPPWSGPPVAQTAMWSGPTEAWTPSGLNPGAGPDGCGVRESSLGSTHISPFKTTDLGSQAADAVWLSELWLGLISAQACFCPLSNHISGQVQSPVTPLPCSCAGPLASFCARVFNCVHSRNMYGATAVCSTLCETLGIQCWR